jgi:transcriptional regulator with XRE-family HTH domain
VSTIVNAPDDPTHSLASRIALEREARGWSLADLAERSGVSKAMISKVERGEASPTATLLGRLSGAFGLTMSTLLARAEHGGGRLSRAAEQPRWQDPATGYIRQQVSPQSGLPLDLVRVELPAGARATFPASSYTFNRHWIWLLKGKLNFHEGDTVHRMEPGDCLFLGSPTECTFETRGREPCTYLVVVMRQ